MKPILFNTEMVRAILDGRKSCTRRVISYSNNIKPNATLDDFAKTDADWDCIKGSCPYQTGDILWVRETWTKLECKDCKTEECVCFPSIESNFNFGFAYKADAIEYGGQWRPSIHMPKEAARLFLRVTGVRVERLQDITEEKAKAEGADYHIPVQSEDGKRAWGLASSRAKFISLWDCTVKKSNADKYGWDANPWVWVVEFERVTENECINRN